MLLQNGKVDAELESVKTAVVLDIRAMWDGGLSEPVQRRFTAFKEHLTPPTLNGNGEDNAARVRYLRER